MDVYEDVMAVEGVEPVADEFGYCASIQRMVNAGCWSLQGSFGRTMMDAIEAGQVLLGRAAAHDYWGNRIPARDEVREGTKGSRAYVASRCGEEWAKRMEAL